MSGRHAASDRLLTPTHAYFFFKKIENRNRTIIIIEQLILVAVGVKSKLPHGEASKPFQGNSVASGQLLIAVCSRTLQPTPVHRT